MPNHTFPSRLRCRARVAIGSLPLAAVSGSIMVSTHRAQPFGARNSTDPIRTTRQPSSSKAAASPVSTRLGRNRIIGSGPSCASGPAAIHSFNWMSDASLVSSSG